MNAGRPDKKEEGWESGGEYQKRHQGTEQAELKVLLHCWEISCKKSAQP